VIVDKAPLIAAANLLSVNAKELEEAILARTMVIPGQPPTKIPFKPIDARAACDALAKAIYGNCFDWLVQRINKSVVVAENLSKRSVALVVALLLFYGQVC
jgi:myosin heavy subunit